MDEVHLWRWPEREAATFGLLLLPDESTGVTVEPPWLDNGPGSCLALGDHYCERTYSPRFKRQLYLIHAAGRSGARFHPGNWAFQSEGCILPGRKVARFPNHHLGVTNSRTSLARMTRVLGGRPFILRIRPMT